MEQSISDNYKYICFTETGKQLMAKLSTGSIEKAPGLKDWTRDNFKQGNILVFIGAMGIAVRAIAPFCKDKTKDAAVIVIDEKGTFVIPVLSGHIGGGVEAAKDIAARIGAIPVITTATDVQNEFAVDVFAKKNDLGIDDMKKAKEFSMTLLAGNEAQFIVSPNKKESSKLHLIPKCTVIGMGCRKGKSVSELYDFLCEILDEKSIDIRSIKALVSADKKKDEEGLIQLSERLGVPFITYSSDVLMKQEGDFEHSDLVMEVTGSDNVCERSVSAYGCQNIIQRKTKKNGMTLAIGMIDVQIKG